MRKITLLAATALTIAGLGSQPMVAQAAAQVRAMECEQRFSHTRPNGTSFATALKEQNVSYRRAGENIARSSFKDGGQKHTYRIKL